MKSFARTIFIVITFLAQCVFAQQWWEIGPSGFSAGEAHYTSFAIDGTGTPYVAYQDAADSNKATVMKFNGTDWESVGPLGFTDDEAPYTSLAIDRNGIPYLAFSDSAKSYKATVMKFNGTSWENVGSAGFSAGNASHLSLAMDETDTLYVAYQDAENLYKATVMKFNGTVWENVGPAGFSAGVVWSDDISLKIDRNGILYIAYTDNSSANKATVMKYNGTVWETVGSAGFSAGGAYSISLAINGSGVPYVVYNDYGNDYKATVMKFNGESWENVGSAGFTPGDAYATSLDIDEDGNLFVAFMDGNNEYKQSVMKYDGLTWEFVGSAGFSAGELDYNTIKIAPSGAPVVAYSDSETYKVTVMKFAVNQNDPLLPVELSAFTASVSDGKIILNWQTATEVNNYGFEIEKMLLRGSHSDPDLSGEESQWEKIGFIAGAGNSNSPKEYTFIDKTPAASAALSYRLKQIDNDGKYSYSKEITVELNAIPMEFSLSQNYPNPFNPSTTIEFSLPKEADVILKVYNLLGQEVATLLSTQMKAGYHKVKFDASGISSGVYLYKIQAGDFSAVKKLMLVK